MKKFLAVLLSLAVVLSLTACGAKADSKKFIMGIDPEYPPFSYMDENGNYTGFDVEVCQAVCEKLGYEFAVFELNWDEKLVQLDAMECDCVWSGMTLLDSMSEAGYTLSAPYFSNTQVLLVKESSGYTSSKDLAGKDVAVMLGTSGDELLNTDLADLAKSFNKVVTCESFLKCFTELGGNAVDAVFVDYPVAAAYARENAGYKIIDENLGAEEYGIAFRSGDKDLCAAVEKAVAELVADGTYAKIAEKYREDDIIDNLIFLR